MANSISAFIHILAFQGQRQLGNDWSNFVYSFQSKLKQSGLEQRSNSPDLLVFTFNHPYAAFVSLLESLDEAKKKHNWKKSMGPVPIQVVLHLAKQDDSSLEFQNSSSPVWDLMQLEVPYVSRSLKQQWDQLMAGRPMPKQIFEKEDQGLYRIQLVDQATLRPERLFLYREYPILGNHRECFYCGMTNHEPAQCPSKFLTMEQQGITTVGYLNFQELNEAYKEIFSNFNTYTNKAAGGINPAIYRKDKALHVYVSCFDLALIFQWRFLWNLAFSISQNWEQIYRHDKLNIDSKSLQLGLDCLRVGNYDQAGEMLEEELKKPQGKKVYAAIGLAFMVLEKGEDRYMPHYLQKAAELANTEKERIYSYLLLARHYDLQSNLWQADNALDTALAVNRNCMEARYCKVQVAVRSGFGEKHISELRAITESQPELFMSALMDPALKPIEGLIEEMFAARIHNHTVTAEKNLSRARLECEELVTWFDADDQNMQVNLKTLANLEKLYEKKSYYGILEVMERALGLIYTCRRVREEKTDKLHLTIRRLTADVEDFVVYWQGYKYRSFFESFSETLGELNKVIAKAALLAQRMEGKSYRQASNLLDSTDEQFAKLRRLYEKMDVVQAFLDGTKKFGRYLLINEGVLICLVLLLMPILAANPGDVLGERAVVLFRDKWFQKQCIFVATVFMAPLLALFFTYFSSSKAGPDY